MRRQWLPPIAAFWLTCFALFFADPYGLYPEPHNALAMILFLSLALVGLTVGASLGGTRFRPVIRQTRLAKRLFLLSLILNIAILPLNVSVYTGTSLWELPGLIFDPAQAYSQMTSTVSGDRAERLDFLIFKALFSWLLVLFLPLAIILYRERHIKLWQVSIACSVALIFSAARGTDKEVFDIAILFLAATLLPKSQGAGVSPDARDAARASARFKLWQLILAAGGLVFVLATFAFRKTQRLADVSSMCFQNTGSCMYLAEYVDNPISFLLLMSYGYLTHAFNGLNAAIDGTASLCPFYGHSAPLTYIAEQIGLHCDSSLKNQLDYLGWTSQGAWSTGFVQMGNDFGLWVVPGLLVFFGWYTQSLLKSTVSGCYISKILFVFNIYILLYMVGNLQIAQTGDMYFGYIFWTTFLIYNTLTGPRST